MVKAQDAASAQLGVKQAQEQVIQSVKLDEREKDLLEAKKLCETSEEDLRKKSPQELQEYIRLLHMYHQKMQEQANYWLDAKEQLVMDAETHNKVIASLVQYAQQQQIAPKGSIQGKKGTVTSKTRSK